MWSYCKYLYKKIEKFSIKNIYIKLAFYNYKVIDKLSYSYKELTLNLLYAF
jgi:hypothetical protein